MKLVWLVVLTLLGWMPVSAEIVQRFSDCVFCPEVIVVPSGSYSRGSSEAQGKALGVPSKVTSRERPVHEVYIGYAFGLTSTITRDQFARFVSVTERKTLPGCFGWRIKPGGWQLHDERDWLNPGYSQSGSHPVVCVSWLDAQAYASWLSEETGEQYRLPTEAEWEYAARAGSTAARFWGDDREEACSYANVYDESAQQAPENSQTAGAAFVFSCNDGYAFTAPVGSFRSNAFGLSDMLGNVWEWVEDCFYWTYVDAPLNGAAALDGICEERVVRGGSAANDPQSLRVSERGKNRPEERYNYLGFRLVREMSD